MGRHLPDEHTGKTYGWLADGSKPLKVGMTIATDWQDSDLHGGNYDYLQGTIRRITKVTSGSSPFDRYKVYLDDVSVHESGASPGLMLSVPDRIIMSPEILFCARWWVDVNSPITSQSFDRESNDPGKGNNPRRMSIGGLASSGYGGSPSQSFGSLVAQLGLTNQYQQTQRITLGGTSSGGPGNPFNPQPNPSSGNPMQTPEMPNGATKLSVIKEVHAAFDNKEGEDVYFTYNGRINGWPGGPYPEVGSVVKATLKDVPRGSDNYHMVFSTMEDEEGNVFFDGTSNGQQAYIYYGSSYQEKNQWMILASDYKAAAKSGAAAVTMDSVILEQSKKDAILAAISQVDHHDLIFKDWGFGEVFEKGTAISLLFYGVPGTGKTLMAQAIANHVGQKVMIVQSGEVQSSEPGQTERNIKKLFKDAAGKKVLVLDECDSLICDRNEVGMILGAEINALLTAIESYTGIVVFTTNRLGKMDPAFERRVSAKIEFPFPTEEQRVHIWKRLIPEKAPLAKDVKFESLAKYPMAGGNIKNAVLNAARHAAYKKKTQIDMSDFQAAAEKEAESIKSFEAAFRTRPNTPRLGGANRAYAQEGGDITKTVEREVDKTIEFDESDADDAAIMRELKMGVARGSENGKELEANLAKEFAEEAEDMKDIIGGKEEDER